MARMGTDTQPTARTATRTNGTARVATKTQAKAQAGSGGRANAHPQPAGRAGPVERANGLTIEDLAAQSGMTVRNIRAHRARGLLPAPEVRDRVGYYGPEHLARLRLITEMQAEGFNLRAIARLLEETHGKPEQLLSLKDAVSAPFETEQPKVFTATELQARFSEEVDAGVLARAEQVGLLTNLGDGRFEVPMPSLLDAAEEVVGRGVPLKHALTVIAKVREQCKAIAREFVRLFLEDLWKPFAQDGYPQERWSEVIESIDRLRPVSSRTLLAVYQLTMSQEVEQAFGRETERLTKRRR
jgi:DNA-binding transcriptional MerR regulator